MSAFPQLGYGFKSNVKTIPSPEPSYIALRWFDNLSIEEAEKILKSEHPNLDFKKLGNLTKFGIVNNLRKRADELLDKYAEKFEQ